MGDPSRTILGSTRSLTGFEGFSTFHGKLELAALFSWATIVIFILLIVFNGFIVSEFLAYVDDWLDMGKAANSRSA